YFRARGVERIYSARVTESVILKIGCNSQDPLWEKRLTQPLVHEPEICQWLEINLKDGEVFFDVGSHYGFFSVFVKTLHPDTKVHSFQPKGIPSYFLHFNHLRMGGREDWKIIEKFVTNRDDDSCAEITLDSYCRDLEVTPSLVKVDIDGGEVDLLRGASGLIEGRKTDFLIEVHPRELDKL